MIAWALGAGELSLAQARRPGTLANADDLPDSLPADDDAPPAEE